MLLDASVSAPVASFTLIPMTSGQTIEVMRGGAFLDPVVLIGFDHHDKFGALVDE